MSCKFTTARAAAVLAPPTTVSIPDNRLRLIHRARSAAGPAQSGGLKTWEMRRAATACIWPGPCLSSSSLPMRSRLHIRDRASRRGHAVIEATLLAPWIFFLFIGVFDMGLYAVALICTENAARAAVSYTPSSAGTAANSTGGCQHALTEMNAMSNARSPASCGASPLMATATSASGVASHGDLSTMNLIPVLSLPAQYTIARTIQRRVKSAAP